MPTRIAWANETWNPVTGCSPVSEGCANCYAKRMANRLRGRCGYPADEPFRVTLHPDRLDGIMRMRPPWKRVFVCSMGDLFHPDVPDEFIGDVWHAMICSGHTSLVLTKRPARMREWMEAESAGHNGWPPTTTKIWLGTTAENQARADERIPALRQTPAAVRFISAEPLLGPIDLPLDGIHWVIVGCESGPRRRPMPIAWAIDIVRQCQAAKVPVFVKQIDLSGRVSHDPTRWPAELQVRAWPA